MTKKIFSTAVCCLALAACSKVSVEQNSDVLLTDGSAFEAGQEVTLTVSTAQTRATSEVNDSIFGFKWEGGDKIKVTVGGSSSEFVLATGAGQTSGTFVGVMPAAGATFDVQFPVDDPDLGYQVYSPSTGPFPHNKAKFAATGCTVGSSFTLTPQHSALQLKLYGESAHLDSIIVTTTSPVGKYKLDCSAAPVTVGSTSGTATPFILVVPASSGNVSFTAQTFTVYREVTPITYTEYASDGTTVVYSGAGIPITSGSSVTSFTSSQTFTSGEVLNMAAKQISTKQTVVWAPVNCGYHSTSYPYGKLYQWGRKYGCGYGKTWTDSSGSKGPETYIQKSSSDTSTIEPENEDSTIFYRAYNSPYDWLSTPDNYRWRSSSGAKTSNDPCPDGWRVPTYFELTTLLNCSTSSMATSTWGTPSGQTISGRTFYGNTSKTGDSLFLPAAGERYFSNGMAENRNSYGYYWSSSACWSNVWILGFGSSISQLSSSCTYRTFGNSIRCVQDSNSIHEGGSLAPYSVTSKTSW